jgi:hypothetical protein
VLSLLDLPGLITDADLDGPAKAVGVYSNHQAVLFERSLSFGFGLKQSTPSWISAPM